MQTKTIAVFLAVALALACFGVAQSASTSGTVAEHSSTRPYLLTFSWSTNSTDQDVNATSSGAYSASSLVAWFVPSATSVPADAYDVQITDSRGLDLFAGYGMNQSNSTANNQNATLPLADSKVTVQVTNGGYDAAGTIYLWLK